MTASIIDVKGDGSGHQLVLSSKDSGATGRVELAETSNTGTLASRHGTNVAGHDRTYYLGSVRVVP